MNHDNGSHTYILIALLNDDINEDVQFFVCSFLSSSTDQNPDRECWISQGVSVHDW